MKFFLLFACLVASAAAAPRSRRGIYGLPGYMPSPYDVYVNRMGPTSGNPAEIAALFPDLDPTVATAIAEGLVGVGITVPTLQKTVLEADPEIVWSAVETVLKTILTTVPAECKPAVAAHAVTGFARHIFMEVLIKDYIHIVEECTEKARIHGAMAPRTGAAGRGDVPTLEQWTAVIDQLKTAIDGKLAALIPATGAVHLEDYFGTILTAIDLLAVKDALIANVLAEIATASKGLATTFAGTPTACQATGSVGEIAHIVNELAAFLTTDAIALINNADLPAPAKPIIRKLTSSLGMVAEDMKGLIRAYNVNDVPAFIVGIMGEIKEEIAISSGIGRIIKNIITPDIIAFVNQKVAAGETEMLLKTIMRTVALTLADLDLPEPEIELLMTNIIKVATGGRPMPPGTGSRIFSFSAGVSMNFW